MLIGVNKTRKTKISEILSLYNKMKKMYFIIALIIVIFITLFISSQIQEGATIISTTSSPKPKGATIISTTSSPKPKEATIISTTSSPKPKDITENLNIVQSILNGTLIIDPSTDKNYLDAINKYNCFIPPGATPLTPKYKPFSEKKPKNTYTFNESVTANDVITKKVGLFPSIVVNMLPMSSFDTSYPHMDLMEPLVFYSAYIVKLHYNIDIITSSGNANVIDSLLQILRSTNFIYDDGKKQYSIQLDEMILYVNSLLAHAFFTGKYKSKTEADFLCNFNTTNTLIDGLLQKIVPLLLNNFSTIGYTNIPISLSLIEVAPLNSQDLIKHVKKKEIMKIK